MKKTLKKLIAFTLAETLLTMAIIGVVAALTVPALKQSSDEKRYISAAKNAYAEISAALSAAEYVHGDAELWKFGTNDDNIYEPSVTVQNYFKEAMNVMDIKGNKKWDRYWLDGSSKDQFSTTFFTVDGMAWSIGRSYSVGGAAIVDVNGEEGPNVIGVDIHGFRIGPSKSSGIFGVFPMGDGLNDTNGHFACTAYVLKHGKMPWLKGGYESCDEFTGK